MPAETFVTVLAVELSEIDERRRLRGLAAPGEGAAIARLYLDNVCNIQSSWVTQGLKVGQLALFFGANDMGSLMIEENVVASAGTVYYLTLEEIKRCIREAGYVPRQRNVFYEYVDETPPPAPTGKRELPVTVG